MYPSILKYLGPCEPPTCCAAGKQPILVPAIAATPQLTWRLAPSSFLNRCDPEIFGLTKSDEFPRSSCLSQFEAWGHLVYHRPANKNMYSYHDGRWYIYVHNLLICLSWFRYIDVPTMVEGRRLTRGRSIHSCWFCEFPAGADLCWWAVWSWLSRGISSCAPKLC